MNKNLYFVIKIIAFLIISINSTSNVYAACNETDPCAPKKVLGAWDKSLAFGFNYTSGNSDTTLLSIQGQAQKETDKNIWDLNTSYFFGEDKDLEDEDNSSTTRNDLRAGASYKRLISERFYLSPGVNFHYDEIADIDYRVMLNPTAGYFFLKDDDFRFSGEVGPSYIFERVGEEEQDYLAPRLGESFSWIISCSSKLFQTAEVLFDSEDSDNTLINAELGIEAAINTSLALVFSIRDNYDNQPAVDSERNDVAVVTALKVKL